MNTKTIRGKTLGIFLSLVLVLSLAAVVLPATPVQAATLLVGPTRTYTTITAAITAAGDGDTIIVDAGTYNAEAAWPIPVSKALTIQVRLRSD